MPFEPSRGDVDTGEVGAEQVALGSGAGQVEPADSGHRAVLAVAAHHIVGAHGLRTGRAFEAGFHPVRVLAEAAQRGAPAHYGPEAVDPPGEDRFEPGLRDLPHAGPGRGHVAEVEGKSREVPGAHGVGGTKRGQQAALVEQFRAQRVHRGCAGLGHGCCALLHHLDLGSAEAEFAGESQAYGSGPHYEYLRGSHVSVPSPVRVVAAQRRSSA